MGVIDMIKEDRYNWIETVIDKLEQYVNHVFEKEENQDIFQTVQFPRQKDDQS